MTREEAKELLPIIQAWAEGKNIQFLSDGEWQDINQTDFTCYPDKYRIKPEPKYRPFKTQEECWNEYLVGKTNDVFGVVKKRLSKSVDPIKDAEILIKEINPKHIEALVALNRLFTIAEAWNKEDGFVPDFSNGNQCKYFPWFIYNNAAAGFVCAYTHYSPVYASAYLGSRLCFKTSERAAQFGKQFAHLYNKVFL